MKRDLGAGFAWDRAPGVTALTAASLAAWSLLSATAPTPKRTPAPMADNPTTGRGDDDPKFLDLDRVRF